MMNRLEEAIIYGTVMHQGKVRKFKNKVNLLTHMIPPLAKRREGVLSEEKHNAMQKAVTIWNTSLKLNYFLIYKIYHNSGWTGGSQNSIQGETRP